MVATAFDRVELLPFASLRTTIVSDASAFTSSGAASDEFGAKVNLPSASRRFTNRERKKQMPQSASKYTVSAGLRRTYQRTNASQSRVVKRSGTVASITL